jgi:hypothetical protein
LVTYFLFIPAIDIIDVTMQLVRATFAVWVLSTLMTGPAYARVSDEARIAEVKSEFKPSSKPLTVLKTAKHGIRYYFQAPGPCSCPTGESVVICTPRFDKYLAEHRSMKPEPKSFACPPEAGCAKGFFTVFVDCPAEKKSKSGRR